MNGDYALIKLLLKKKIDYRYPAICSCYAEEGESTVTFSEVWNEE